MILFLIALTVWRLTSLLVYEDGPWYVFENLRHLFGVRNSLDASQEDMDMWLQDHPGETVPDHFAISLTGEILICFFCASFWVSLGVVALLSPFVDLPIWQLALMPFAVSTAAIAVNEWIHGQS